MAAKFAAPSLTFYTQPLAYNPGKVAVMLAEKNLPHKTVKVDLFAGGSLNPDFMRINPASSVPVLKDDGKVILESKVICQHLDNLDGAPLGGDKVDRAFVDKFLQEVDAWDGNLYAFAHTPPGITKTIKSIDEFRKKVAAARAKENPDLAEVYQAKIKNMSNSLDAAGVPEKVEACEKGLAGIMDTAEARLTTQGGVQGEGEVFLAGPAYSIADAVFAPIMFRVFSLGQYQQVIAPRPAVASYMKRMRARPSWNAAFGQAGSTWGKVSIFVPAILSVKVRSLLGRY